MDPELSISTGNAILFTAALFGAIASYSRPIRSPYDPNQPWERWDISLLSFLGYLWLLVIVILFAPVLGQSLTNLILPGNEENEQVQSIGATLIMQTGLVAIILSAVHMRGWSLMSFFRHEGVSEKNVFLHAGHLFLRYIPTIWLVGMLWAGILFALKSLGFDVSPQPQIAAQWIADSDSAPFLIIMGIMVVITAPISEELVFRAFLYRFLRNRWSARFALIFSSVLFALLHASLHSFLPLVFMGLLLAKIYEDTHDIRTPILFHLFFNLFSYLNLIFLP
ncbi:CPBP family intramembrane glutamic endopeptidase [Puniceicoccus vermicola]|uniref:CPBP family intramembrane metalloprotease n=1 Tax=Puniceicoccus vermicola TaxID=388746 RepID=A0A7X1B236_9BACT|nr:CPBP family intramembrane glutamic endopeptidase [Puniceicoccus vermicola]MBC2604059.1 CPBP family intramembrane metalloprotease [Puniceicoccus vermicola]